MDSKIIKNRRKYLKILKSGKYTKGCTESDINGKPVIKTEEDDKGTCACGIIQHEFGEEKDGRFLISKGMKALNLTSKDCRYIQDEMNDTPDDFNTIADRIKVEVFKNKC